MIKFKIKYYILIFHDALSPSVILSIWAPNLLELILSIWFCYIALSLWFYRYGLPYWNFKKCISTTALSAPIYDMFSLLRYFIQTLLCCIICCSCVAAADLKLNWLRNLVDLYQFQNSKDIFQQVQCFPKEVLHQVFTLICQLMQLPSLVSCCVIYL